MPGLGLGIGLNRVKSVGSSYDADAQLYFNRITALGQTEPDDAEKSRDNTLVTDLKSATQWDEFIRIWLIGSQNKENGFISLINPESDLVLEAGGGIDFTQYEGIKGTPGYLNSKFNGVDDGGSIFLEEGQSIFLYFRNTATNDLANFGSYQTSPGLSITQCYPAFSGALDFTINGTTGGGGTNPKKTGMLHLKRDSGFLTTYQDGIQILGPTAVTSTGAVGVDFHFPGRSTPAGANEEKDTARQMAVVALASKDVDPWLVNKAFTKWLDARSKAVPLVAEKRTLILMSGQSNNTERTLISGNITSPYTDVIPNIYSGNKLASTNPFTFPVEAYQTGVNSWALSDTTMYGWWVYMAYKLGVTYGDKCTIVNDSLTSTPLSKTLGPQPCWDATETGELFDTSRDNYYRPGIYRSNPLVKTFEIWNHGNRDADDLTAANAYYDNLVAYFDKRRETIANGGLGDPTLIPVIILFKTDYSYPYTSTVRAAQEQFVTDYPGAIGIDLDSILTFNVGDEAHWNKDCFQVVGEYVADIIHNNI